MTRWQGGGTSPLYVCEDHAKTLSSSEMRRGAGHQNVKLHGPAAVPKIKKATRAKSPLSCGNDGVLPKSSYISVFS